MGDYAIEATDLVREFKNGPRAVDAIDLGVAPGEIYGFLGPNGAGKSTTVHMLTTLLPPTSGTARVAGYDVVSEGSHVRATIGAALQDQSVERLRVIASALGERHHEQQRASEQPLRDRIFQVVQNPGMHAARARLRMKQARRDADLDHAFSATSTSSSIFFASPNSIRLLSL